jgi:protein-L-isoaspartate(D-aspartate) O-methyltransferase
MPLRGIGGAHTWGMNPPGPQELVRAIRRAGVGDSRLLSVVAAIPRAGFVPASRAAEAYRDEPLPIPHGQVTTQPSLVAKMVDALSLSGSERVLEVGSGYGWQTALLAALAAEVWSVERWPDLADVARVNLEEQGIANAEVVVGDGSEGLPEQAPYDGVLVSAAFPEVPPPLVEQLAAGGRLVQPIGSGGSEDVVLFEKAADGALRPRRSITGARFVRLWGRHGFRPTPSES